MIKQIVVGIMLAGAATLAMANDASSMGTGTFKDLDANGDGMIDNPTDTDGDGMSEVVTVDFGGTVHVWDYDAPFSPGGPAPWPQFHHDSRRTGSTEVTDLLGIDLASAAVPVDVGIAECGQAYGEVVSVEAQGIESHGDDRRSKPVAGKSLHHLAQCLLRPVLEGAAEADVLEAHGSGDRPAP